MKKLIKILAVFSMLFLMHVPHKVTAAQIAQVIGTATYTASGTEHVSLPASKAFDGNKDRTQNSRWASNLVEATEENPIWIQADYENPVAMAGIKIHWERANVTKYRVEVSQDGTQFSTVYASNQPKGQWIETIAFDSVKQVKKLKVVVTGYNPRAFDLKSNQEISYPTVSIWEIEPLAAVEEVQDASVATMTARANDEEAPTNVAQNAVDKNSGTRWATNLNVQTPEINITFDKLTTISAFNIDWERKGDRHNVVAYEASFSEDGTYYFPLHKRTTNTKPQKEMFQLTHPQNAKHVKLKITNYTGGIINYRNIGISEIEFFKEKTVFDGVDTLTFNTDSTEVVLPTVENTTFKIVGSNADQVIDLNGKVFKPLTRKDVKVTLEATKNDVKSLKEVVVSVPGQYENTGTNAKPSIVPALQEWYGHTGETTINDQTTITAPADFNDAVTMFKADLSERGVTIAENANGGSSIVFEKVETEGYGKEGYFIEAKDNVIRVKAATNTGAFYATRTLLQMNQTITNGIIRDYPSFEHRGFMLDVGRKFVSLEYVYQFMKTMSYYKMNDFQLHLNDNLIFLPLVGTTQEEIFANAPTGFRLESNIQNAETGVKLTSENHYTKAQFKKLIQDSKKYGVTIVPEFDTPGHALSFTKVRPDLIYQGNLGNHSPQERFAMLDLNNEQTLPFIKSLYNEMLDGDDPVLQDVPIHIGSDEYYGDTESYRAYVDNMLKFIRDEKHRTVRLWGSLTQKNGTTPVTSKNVQMHIWNGGWANPQAMLNQGFDLINILDGATYIVPAAGYYYDYLNTNYLYNTFKPNVMGQTTVNESHPQMLGGSFAIWNDMIGPRENGITSYDMFARFHHAVPYIAQKNWASSNDLSYQDFTRLIERQGVAPATNPYFDEIVDDITYQPTNAQVNENTWTLNGGTSYLATNKNAIGPNQFIEFDITLNNNEPNQILAENDTYGATIFAVNKDGYIGYKQEEIEYAFNYKLIPNRKTNIKFVTEYEEVRLYVDGEDISLLNGKGKNTVVFPLQRIGSKTSAVNGEIANFTISQETYVDNNIVTAEEIETATASSEQTANQEVIMKAFDRDARTMWHSKWGQKNKPYTVEVTLKNETPLTKLKYIPRQDGSKNGIIKEYQLLLASENGEYVKVAEGNWTANSAKKTIDFNEVKHVKKIKLIVNGHEDFASAAEFMLFKKPVLPFFGESSDKNVRVFAPSNVVNDSFKLVVQPVTVSIPNKKVVAYDIKLVSKADESVTATFSGNVEVAIRLPEGFVENEFVVLHENDTTPIPYTVKNGFVVFNANAFSVYQLVRTLAESEIIDFTAFDAVQARILAFRNEERFIANFEELNTRINAINKEKTYFTDKTQEQELVMLVTDLNEILDEVTYKPADLLGYGLLLKKFEVFNTHPQKFKNYAEVEEKLALFMQENPFVDPKDIRDQEALDAFVAGVNTILDTLVRTSETVVDTHTSVKVNLESGNFPLFPGVSVKQLDFVPTFTSEDSDLYDIHITDTTTNQNVVFENGHAIVALPIEQGRTVKAVYHVTDNDVLENIETYRVEENMVKFTVTHFSKYGVVYEPKVTKPQEPEVKPQQPEVKPNQPEVKPQQPEVKPNQPEVKPNKPQIKPQQPEVKPQTQKDKVDTSEVNMMGYVLLLVAAFAVIVSLRKKD